MSPQVDTRIGVLLLPHFSYAELGLILEPLFITNWLLQEKRFQWRLFGLEGDSVVANNELRVDVEPELPEAETLDIIFVLASFEPQSFSHDRRARLWLRRAATAGVELCGVQMGVELIAATGLLNGHRAAVHWDNLDGFMELYPDVDARPDLYTMESGRMSCAGGTAVTDLMFQWLRPKLDESIFGQVRSHMLEPRIRTGGVFQASYGVEEAAAAHPGVRRALELMKRTLEEPLQTPEIAAQIGISVRQLERRFRSEMGVSPSKYYMRLRIARAHRLLQQTDLSVADVAAGAGFQSLEHFSRVYRRYYGCAPSSDRVQTTGAPAIPREE
jgi:AraC family carnitine catabolism transcriptional activator